MKTISVIAVLSAVITSIVAAATAGQTTNSVTIAPVVTKSVAVAPTVTNVVFVAPAVTNTVATAPAVTNAMVALPKLGTFTREIDVVDGKVVHRLRVKGGAYWIFRADRHGKLQDVLATDGIGDSWVVDWLVQHEGGYELPTGASAPPNAREVLRFYDRHLRVVVEVYDSEVPED